MLDFKIRFFHGDGTLKEMTLYKSMSSNTFRGKTLTVICCFFFFFFFYIYNHLTYNTRYSTYNTLLAITYLQIIHATVFTIHYLQ